jgi:hypothetical protein
MNKLKSTYCELLMAAYRQTGEYKIPCDLYDIKIEASGLVKLRDKANRTITYCSPGAWTNVRINDLHDLI